MGELMAIMHTGVDTSRGDDSRNGRVTFELLSTILLALAAIATAWAGFQLIASMLTPSTPGAPPLRATSTPVPAAFFR